MNKFLLIRRFIGINVKPAAKIPNADHMRGQPVTFERSFPVNRRKKAWEKDNMDKDTWFRKKYAHIHAIESKKKSSELYVNEKSSRKRIINRELENKRQREQHKLKFNKNHATQGLTPNPLMEYIFGINSVLMALKENKRDYFTRVLYYGELSPMITPLCKKLNIPTEVTDKHKLNLLTNYGVHNNIVLEAKPYQPIEITHMGFCNHETEEFECSEMVSTQKVVKKIPYLVHDSKKFPLGIYLDEVVDPHNIGAIIRSAYFLGADFVVLSHKNCASLSPVVSKTSSGAMELLPIYITDKPIHFFEMTKQEGGWVFITSRISNGSVQTKNRFLEVKDLSGMLLKAPVMLVVGNEGKGVRTNLLQRSDYFVEIPSGRNNRDKFLDSLNVSVATALIINSLLT